MNRELIKLRHMAKLYKEKYQVLKGLNVHKDTLFIAHQEAMIAKEEADAYALELSIKED